MPDEPTPDYTTMTGAQFQRAVGADPERWADAFCQVIAQGGQSLPRGLVLSWFTDAMDAAVKAHKLLPDGVVDAVVTAACHWHAADIYVQPNLSREDAVRHGAAELIDAVQRYKDAQPASADTA